MGNVFRYFPRCIVIRRHAECRSQANMGAKNHAVIMPDGEFLASIIFIYLILLIILANKNQALNAIIGAAFGGMCI